jgi:potassium-transporting ATPase KdpC subunit
MKREFKTAFWMTIVTTILFGFVYPLIITGLAHLLFPNQSNGSLIHKNNVVIGSKLIGQAFSSPGYFHSRPSAAGNGYDGLNSGGSNLGPTNRQLISRVENDAKALRSENPSAPIPVDLVTTSASGLDPDISPEAAEFQIPRVARARRMSEAEVRDLVREHTEDRQFRILGEPRVNVLELNLDLDAVHPMH